MRPIDLASESPPRGHRNQMNVIAHQAISKNPCTVTPALLGENAEVGPAIVVDEENILSIVPALREMMGKARHDNPGSSWHGEIIANASSTGKNNR